MNKKGSMRPNAHVSLRCRKCYADIYMNCVEAPLEDEANKIALGDALSKLLKLSLTTA